MAIFMMFSILEVGFVVVLVKSYRLFCKCIKWEKMNGFIDELFEPPEFDVYSWPDDHSANFNWIILMPWVNLLVILILVIATIWVLRPDMFIHKILISKEKEEE